MIRRYERFSSLALTVALCAHAIASVRYRVVYIPSGPCQECHNWADPRDINNLGQVCGDIERYYQGIYAELWDPATPETVLNLGGLPGCGSTAAHIEAMNDLSHVVGADGACGTAYLTGCMWTPESGWTELERLPGWRGSRARAINNQDQIVGSQDIAATISVGCLWDPVQGAIELGRGPLNFDVCSPQDLNESTWITGYGYGAGGGGAFLWTPQAGMTMIDGMNIANAINNHGVVAGFRAQTNLDREAVIWSPETGIRGLGWMPDYGQQWTIAHDINDQGVVIGEARVKGWVEGMWQTSFVWSPHRGMLDLNRRRDPCHPVSELRDVLYAVAINDAGVIITVPESEFVKAALLIPYIPGDLDEDGVCDLQDLAIQLSNFGRRGVGYPEGDLDCQGDVDLQDLATLLTNFGDSLP